MTDVRVYTTAICPYCFAAKRLLGSLDIPFEEISLDGRPEERLALSEKHGGWRTVPMIFIGERMIGGYNELKELARSGELIRLAKSEQGDEFEEATW